MTCINCSTEGDGKFCSNCSQRLVVKRINWKEGFHDFWARIYGFDGMFPRTFKDLTVRPGFAAREFIKGNRARYYGPVGYFFLMITCFLLLLSLLGLNYLDYMKSMQEALPAQDDSKLNNDIRDFAADNVKLIVFLVIPFQAFAARYFFFRKQELNFLEHSILPLYIMGHWYWVHMAEAVYFYFVGSTMGAPLHSLLTALYMGFGYTSLVTSQPKWKVFLKGIGVHLAGFLVFMLAIMILTIVVIIILGLIDPSMLNGIRPSRNK
jgi:hypothetical protein